MKIEISSDAELDIKNGYWFYESQSLGVGDYFRSSIFSDIDSLVIHGGSHPIEEGFHRKVCKTFPYKICQRENRKPKTGG